LRYILADNEPRKVELLVPMTWPITAETEHAPEMLEILRTYKEAFAKPGPFKALFNIMVRIMSIPAPLVL
jgi:hypothetical protein